MSLSTGDLTREFPDGRPLSAQPQWRKDFPTDVPEDDHVGRRDFTKFLVLTSGAFAAGQCWIAAASLRKSDEPLPEISLGKFADLPVGSVREFRYPTEDDPCLLIRPSETELMAYSQKCTHLSCAVIPNLEERHLHCPCHNGFFDLESGRPTAGPPRRPLPRVILEIRDGEIFATDVELRTV
jgi:Rieske Fe-S protein